VARVLCVGIATCDHVYKIDAMPTVAHKYRASDLVVTGGGTAANAAFAIARLGGRPLMVADLGDDRVGDEIVAGLERVGVDCSGVARIPGLTSPISAILVDGAGERTIISYSDPRLPAGTSRLPSRLPEGVDAVLGDTRWQSGSAHFFRLAREAGVPAVLDADRAPREAPELLDLATHVGFSMQALEELTGVPEPRRALEALGPRGDVWLCVTNGGEGAFWRDGAVIRHEPAPVMAVVDTLGAGDTWHGALALRLAEGATEAQAVRFACVAASLKCTRFGSRDGAPHRGEVEAFIQRGNAI
jgi:sulfofructose kinase